MADKVGTADGYVDAVMAVFPGSRCGAEAPRTSMPRLWRQLTQLAALAEHGESARNSTAWASPTPAWGIRP